MDELIKTPNYDDVTCYHDELDPTKGNACRLVSAACYDRLKILFPGTRRLEPCFECVKDEWKRARNSSEHRGHVSFLMIVRLILATYVRSA